MQTNATATSNPSQQPSSGSCKPFYRITLIVLSVLFLVSAILCFAKVGALSQLGNVGGGVGLGLSAVLFVLSFFCREQEQEKAKPHDFTHFGDIVKQNLLAVLPKNIQTFHLKLEYNYPPSCGKRSLLNRSGSKINSDLDFEFGLLNNLKGHKIDLVYLLLIEDTHGSYHLFKDNLKIELNEDGTINPLYQRYKEPPTCAGIQSLANILNIASIGKLSITEADF